MPRQYWRFNQTQFDHQILPFLCQMSETLGKFVDLFEEGKQRPPQNSRFSQQHVLPASSLSLSDQGIVVQFEHHHSESCSALCTMSKCGTPGQQLAHASEPFVCRILPLVAFAFWVWKNVAW
jgi:hypothetical protein